MIPVNDTPFKPRNPYKPFLRKALVRRCYIIFVIPVLAVSLMPLMAAAGIQKGLSELLEDSTKGFKDGNDYD
jgi:hypothetical protein